MGKQRFVSQNTEDVLRRFGGTTAAGRKNLVRYLQEGAKLKNEFQDMVRASNLEIETARSSSCWVIGNRDFVQRALKNSEKLRRRILIFSRLEISLEDISGAVCRYHNIKRGDLRKKGRNNAYSQARKMCAYLACRVYQYQVTDVANLFGVHVTAVSRMLNPGEKIIEGLPDIFKSLSLPRP